ncbi:hypothetical protein ANO11243_082490 [Dothideomycetidae sp. 11243]|nr:hypothetical protein ANO11243_082490 [fungal sp. No.11243]
MSSAQDAVAQGQDSAEAQPSSTFINNLEEKLKIPALKETLQGLFAEYGTIIDIVAKKSLKRKGQAFVVYETVESAQAAIDDLDGFDLAGKEIRCTFAKTRSDAIVKRDDTEQSFEEHVRARKAEKERKEKAEQENNKKRSATEAAGPNKSKMARSGPVSIDDSMPSSVLVVQGIPDDYDENAMSAIFGRYPDFKEFHAVPHRKGLGFAHYETIEGATHARQQVAGISLGESKITITYRKA